MQAQPPFDRTICACGECQAACDRHPGYMAPGDWERIAAHIGVDADRVAHLFERGDGVVVGDRATGKMWRIPTIRPRFRDTGRCVFLDDQHRCTVHAVAPAGCAYHDMHLPAAEANRRSMWFLRRIQDDADYRARWRALPDPEQEQR